MLATVLGGVTGLLGNVVGGWFKMKERKMKIEENKVQNQHELAMVDAETRAMIEEAKANIRIAQTQVEGAIDLKEADAYIQSQKEGNKQMFSNKWIDRLMGQEGWIRYFTIPLASLIAVLFGLTDFLRGILRPTLTIYLCGITTWVTWMAWQIMQKEGVALDGIQAAAIFSEITSIVTYLTVSCVTWWFGDRTMAKNIMKTKGIDNSRLNDKIDL